MENRETLEYSAGQLYSDLWKDYDTELFEKSVELFSRRLRLAQFDTDWFSGKKCLDAACGGGRNTIAMARLGARAVTGIDVGETGLDDARRRAKGMPNVEFRPASILSIPFEDESFDMVWCAGVLMMTHDEDKALDELTRVTKKGGYLYLLVLATGGMRWPLVRWLQSVAAQIGKAPVERAIQLAGLPANKRRTFLDDLFCPHRDFYYWNRLERMLKNRGFRDINRWGTECRLDHEADLESYREDLEALAAVFSAGDNERFGSQRLLFRASFQAISATLDTIRWFENAVKRGEVTRQTAMECVIGQGHHRVLAIKG